MPRDQRGQATLELLAAIPLMLGVGLIVFQLLAMGYCSSLADQAAEAAALALAADRDPVAAAEATVPGWARDRLDVATEGGELTVSLAPPSPLAAVGVAPRVSSSAWVRSPAGDG